jgi:arginyl-tRNA synthetase
LKRKAEAAGIEFDTAFNKNLQLLPKEKELLKQVHEYPVIIKQAGENYSPALIANYIYELVKEYNQFYQEIPILKENDAQKVIFRLQLSHFCGQIIKFGMNLLGIKVPERM